ncbi:MAG: sodium:calcium antiporter, partial [Muribaculaceae bacterium]|nr:sodium:calcium antiporter [Muribaculaceae bacterium]
VIGLTLVAAGTSLPELATSVVAALKKNPGIAIGNVIGSCLFNVFFIIGTAATISPLPLGGITQTDMLTLVGASVLLWFFGLVIGDRKITRVEGVFMLLCYIAYTAWLIINS